MKHCRPGCSCREVGRISHEPRDALGPESHGQHVEMLMVWGCGTWTPCPPSCLGFYNMWAFITCEFLNHLRKQKNHSSALPCKVWQHSRTKIQSVFFLFPLCFFIHEFYGYKGEQICTNRAKLSFFFSFWDNQIIRMLFIGVFFSV